MKVTGKVIKTNGIYADVAFKRSSACGESCATCSAVCNKKQHIAKAKNEIGAKAGDTVDVFLNDKSSYRALVLVFILPIILFVLVYAILFSFLKSHAFCSVISLAVFCVYLFSLKRFDSLIAPEVEITEVLARGKDEVNGA